MIQSGADLMLSGLLHGGPGSEHILGGQVLGPPEAFYRFTSINADGLTFDDDDFEEDDDDPEYMLNLQDFIDFGESSSDSEVENDTNVDSSAIANPILATSKNTFAPTRAGPMSAQQSSTQNLMQHFDRGVVSSFRRNQARHQSLLRRPNLSNSIIGIKGGRHIAANTPISPLRKQMANRGLSGNTNPFQGVTARRRVTNKIYKKSKNSI